MLGLASSWVVDQKRYWSVGGPTSAHHTHYLALSGGACLADGCSHLGKGQKTEETSRCVRLRLVGGSAQLTVEHPPHVLEPGGEEEREEDVAEVEAQKEWPIRNGRCTERANALRTLVSKSAALAALSM